MNASLASHEFVAALDRHTASPSQAQIDTLLRNDVPPWSIAGAPGSGEHSVRFARVVFDGSRFDFAPTADFDMPAEGVPAAVVLALNDFAEPADLVAWPLKGDGLASWLGAVAMLGQQHVGAPRVDPALNVYRTGFDWLRGGREGVVLIDPERASRVLWDCGPFRAVDIDHARRLQSMLTPAAPSVVVAVPERIAA